jgi:hypothetical protein
MPSAKAARKKKKPAVKPVRKPALRRAVKKTARAAVAKKRKKPAAKRARKAQEKLLGLITHYFPKVRAAVVDCKAPVAVGDKIRIKGHTTDFTQVIASMQLDHVTLNQAKKGDCIGLLVNSRVRRHDLVLKA